jgi:ATP-dependent DNA helicase RecG
MTEPAAQTRDLPQSEPRAKLPAGMPGSLRPGLLNPLFAGLPSLPGVGPAIGAALARLLQRPTPTCLDLLSHLPTAVIDPAPRERLTPADNGQMVTLSAWIEGHRPAPPHGRMPYRILAGAAGEQVELAFFRAREDSLAARFAVGGTVLIHGQLRRFGERWQMTHPELLDARRASDGLLPVYPLVQGLWQGRLRAIARAALDRLPELPEWLPAELLARQNWPGWAAATRAVHRPASAAGLEPHALARRRLAFDELLAGQLSLGLTRRAREHLPGRALPGDGRLVGQMLASLPFPCTGCQASAIAEIGRDLAASAPMLRLLQGDVGSGKTVVALAAMLQAVEAGVQAALMAPTEVLARQHAATFGRLLALLGLTVELLTGKDPAGQRRAAKARLADGTASLAVGTHALFRTGVVFADLGLVVIDEQHRFGVNQRLDLVVKGAAVDVLLMTATPIPRSLVLAAYGDIATSRLLAKPPGRAPILTRATPNERIEQVVAATERARARGARMYWVCPVIEEAEGETPMAAIERHRLLAERFGPAVGLVHGRLASRDKEAAIAAFATGRTPLLVATTVIEVGVDVPAASIIVIEHAERFGLAQLQQLRGRVGRGQRPAACLLLYASPLGATARARLALLRATEDGFAIAEEDLRLRGPGEVLGLRQSGMPAFRFADLGAHADLLPLARDVAQRALAADPGLRGPASEPLRVLLHLFERHDAVRLLAAG